MCSELNVTHRSNQSAPSSYSTSSLNGCLVDGDAAQQKRNRRLRRRSLFLSVVTQIVFLLVLILVPILSKTERITLANVMPMPPYRPLAAAAGHDVISHPRPHTLHFCLDCRPTRPNTQPSSNVLISDQAGSTVGDSTSTVGDCSECRDLLPNAHPQPVIPSQPSPRIIHVATLDPAMLIHRVEPIFPTLPRQMGREGRVELHAVIAVDGSVSSLQFVDGDQLFYPSARDAVAQWRYKPTVLNGVPVEVDTRITVIYKLNR